MEIEGKKVVKFVASVIILAVAASIVYGITLYNKEKEKFKNEQRSAELSWVETRDLNS